MPYIIHTLYNLEEATFGESTMHTLYKLAEATLGYSTGIS